MFARECDAWWQASWEMVLYCTGIALVALVVGVVALYENANHGNNSRGNNVPRGNNNQRLHETSIA